MRASSSPRKGCPARIGPAIVGACLFFALVSQPGVAFAQEASRTDQEGNAGEDFFRPPANLFQTMTQYKSTLGSGSTSGSIVNVPSETLKLRYDHSIELAPLWILALRSDLPTIAKNPVSSSNPNGEYEIGIGDADTQAAIIHNLSQRWAIAVARG